MTLIISKFIVIVFVCKNIVERLIRLDGAQGIENLYWFLIGSINTKTKS